MDQLTAADLDAIKRTLRTDYAEAEIASMLAAATFLKDDTGVSDRFKYERTLVHDRSVHPVRSNVDMLSKSFGGYAKAHLDQPSNL